MKTGALLALSLAVAAGPGAAVAGPNGPKEVAVAGFMAFDAPMPKSAAASTVASRAFASSGNTVYGGFELAQSTTVYILVRGNSLGSLGITQGYLDAPHVRLFNSAGADLITEGGFAGFNDCDASAASDAPVVNYYAARGIPVHPRDSCLAASFSAGAYTFTVTPSTSSNNGFRVSGNNGPSSGEILFEVKLGP